MCEAQFNGLKHRWADTSPGDSSKAVVLFLHGWPECWFSWRHQLKAIKAAGFRGVAPDMRGYAGTDAPSDMENYNVYCLCGDMLGLLQHLGAARAALVGHDHGANLGWKLALMHPDVFFCYMAMSVPYRGRGKTPPIERFRSAFGDERLPETKPRFFYQLHHQLPCASAAYAQDTRAALNAILQWGCCNETALPAPVVSDQLYVEGHAEPMWRRMPQPHCQPPWLSEEELEYMVGEFKRTGWDGGLNWYRVMDLDWIATPQLAGRKLAQPVAFLAGANDVVIQTFGGQAAVTSGLARVCHRLESVQFLHQTGHWIQQERPDEVNKALVDFLRRHCQELPPRSNL